MKARHDDNVCFRKCFHKIAKAAKVKVCDGFGRHQGLVLPLRCPFVDISIT